MLLRNESRIRHSIQIKLVFDDNRKRELEIQECDCVQVSYRKNGCIRQGVGVIRKIEPYIHHKKFSCCARESAVITLDMSEDHVCCVDKFDIYDIIDIRKVQISKPEDDDNNITEPDFDVNNGCQCGCNCQKPEPEPEPIVKKNKTGCFITEKGVLIRD